MFYGSCGSIWLFVLYEDYFYYGRIKMYFFRFELEIVLVNFLLYCIIFLMRE